MELYYEQAELDHMVCCEKTILDPPRREMQDQRGCKRNDMRLQSTDSRYKFQVFMRISNDFPENFSVGLDLLSPDGPRIPLLRCNGAHEGIDPNPRHPIGNHFGFHIHRTLAEDLAMGISSCRDVEQTVEYAGFDEALRYFLKRCSVLDAQRHFPDLDQSWLPFE